ncbi:hypothetical protein BJX70DRAFT_392131 [Aspergillus crustosus]
MAHCTRKADYQSSDDSDNSNRDSTEDSQYNTDLTEPEDDDNKVQDAGDAALLFTDNKHPLEYYIQQLANFDKAVYTKEDYGKGTTALLNRKDPQEELTCLSVAILKNGRRLPGTKYKSLLDTFWKVFCLKHKLSLKGQDKPPLDVKDLVKVVETTISITEKKFGHGCYYIKLGLFLQLASLTINRPQAILNLRYQYIQVSLLRDPQGGPHRIMIKFTFKFTKEWLGAKDAYIIKGLILLLIRTLFLLGLLFTDHAFDQVNSKEVLVSASQLPGLQIRDKCNKLLLISPSKPLLYLTLEPWVKEINTITGFRAGTALDSSSSVSNSLRNLIMYHADTHTFLYYYLSRRINKNLPVIICGLDPEDNLIGIFKLVRLQDELRTEKYAIYKKLNQEITGARQHTRDALLSQTQDKYNQEQLMLEIQRQLSGAKLSKEEKSLKYSEEMARRTEAINTMAAYSLFEEGNTCRLPREKRSPKDYITVKPANEDKNIHNTKLTETKSDDPLAAAIRSVIKDRTSMLKGDKAKIKVKRPLFYFICLGKPDLDVGKQTYKFTSHGDVTKHIK